MGIATARVHRTRMIPARNRATTRIWVRHERVVVERCHGYHTSVVYGCIEWYLTLKAEASLIGTTIIPSRGHRERILLGAPVFATVAIIQVGHIIAIQIVEVAVSGPVPWYVAIGVPFLGKERKPNAI
ncbi:hypothetical protein F4859DRAFT_494561 [Xylaria cf. heliscus]|nr:hypothetical protein F4859DRAFT_494561 [Xylaria cf. heliscus]